MSELKSCRMIETKFLEPTNFRGSRVKATDLSSGKSKTITWNHELGIVENHEQAVLQLGEKPFVFAAVKDKGYIFGVKF